MASAPGSGSGSPPRPLRAGPRTPIRKLPASCAGVPHPDRRGLTWRPPRSPRPTVKARLRLGLPAGQIAAPGQPSLPVHGHEGVELDRQREQDDQGYQRQQQDVGRVPQWLMLRTPPGHEPDGREPQPPSARAGPPDREVKPPPPIVTGVSRIWRTVSWRDERHAPQPPFQRPSGSSGTVPAPAHPLLAEGAEGPREHREGVRRGLVDGPVAAGSTSQVNLRRHRRCSARRGRTRPPGGGAP